MQFPDSRIIVFCKAPVSGQVKTRLAKNIGESAAALVHQHLAQHCLRTVTNAQIAPVELWCTPNTHHDFFQQCDAKFGVVLKEQKGEELGERMDYAFSRTLPKVKNAVIIGTDCPAITSAYLSAAFLSMENDNAVIGPAEDGGYVLLGLTKHQPEIFKDISWGTSGVFSATMSRLDGRVEKLPTLWDVDYLDDLMRMRSSTQELQLSEAFSEYLGRFE